MGTLISVIMSILGSLLNLYMLLILIRFILSWFQGISFGKFYDVLCAVSDPYLNWFRRFRAFQTPTVDFSPVVAMAALSLASNICYRLAGYGRISLGIILALVLYAAWSFVSFVLGFFIVFLILQLISYITNQDVYNGFWRIVDMLTQPLLYQLNSRFFKMESTDSRKCIIAAILTLAVILIVLGLLVTLLGGVLEHLPI